MIHCRLKIIWFLTQHARMKRNLKGWQGFAADLKPSCHSFLQAVHISCPQTTHYMAALMSLWRLEQLPFKWKTDQDQVVWCSITINSRDVTNSRSWSTTGKWEEGRCGIDWLCLDVCSRPARLCSHYTAPSSLTTTQSDLRNPNDANWRTNVSFGNYLLFLPKSLNP